MPRRSCRRSSPSIGGSAATGSPRRDRGGPRLRAHVHRRRAGAHRGPRRTFEPLDHPYRLRYLPGATSRRDLAVHAQRAGRCSQARPGDPAGRPARLESIAEGRGSRILGPAAPMCRGISCRSSSMRSVASLASAGWRVRRGRRYEPAAAIARSSPSAPASSRPTATGRSATPGAPSTPQSSRASEATGWSPATGPPPQSRG